ncbi:hypothetical protein ACFFQF_08835 [Haladaptatus pallidirubidus]|uniref:Uncharacterized protein n=1 Tax=Haladaptatus pallidirubidus TaxID=1008152 RepID=A0AAV3UFJ5_9EURY|nr:hypothetical protein [Haladaptatus pallidirubidus]
MTRAFPVVLAVFLALTAPTAAFETGSATSMQTEADTDSVVTPPGVNNTTAQLSLGTPDRTGTDAPSTSLGAALEMNRNEVETQSRIYELDEKLSNTNNDQERHYELRQYRFEIGSRLSSLKYTEQEIRTKFNDGEISSEEYLRRLAVLHAKSENVERSIQYMEARGQDVPQFTPRAWTLKAELIPLKGAIRESAINQYTGQTESRTIYVATTDTGVVLSSISGNQYVREAYLSENRNINGTNQLLAQEAQNITETQYPWAKENNNGEISTNSRFGTGIFVTTLPHEQGVVKAVLDGKTEKIFRETQYGYLTGDSHIPYGEVVQNNTTDHQLTVNRTYPGGPLRINVTDGNGNAVDSRITIGDREIGKTGSDGVLWTIAPRRTSTVSSTHGTTTLNVTVTPYGLSQSNQSEETPQSFDAPES